MPDADDMIIGLFPLRLVLLPGEVLPLHVFEERYKRLVADCRGDDGVFGMLLAEKDAVAECGCTAGVYEVIEEFDDGRLNILVEGRERFRLHELIQPDDAEADYLRGRVTPFPDADLEADDEAIVECAALFERVVALMGVESPRVPEGDALLSFRLAAAVDFGLPLKQRVLETASEPDRLELLSTVMRALIPGLELRKEREEAIRGNGKGN